MKSIDLIHHQISLEYHLDLDGWLVPYPYSTEQAYYIVYRYSQGYVPYFNHRLPSHVRRNLLSLGPKQAFNQPAEVIKIFNAFQLSCSGGEKVFQSGYFASLPELDEPVSYTHLTLPTNR